jgi:hypothetical protein
MYAPSIVSAKSVMCYDLGLYFGVLFKDIVSAGFIEYLYVLSVGPKDRGPICLYVTSEKNMMDGRFGAGKRVGSHFLCSFKNNAHSNHGASDDWADLDKFETRAVAMAAEEVNFPLQSIKAG